MKKNLLEDALFEILKTDDGGAISAIITGMNEPRFVEIVSYIKKDLDTSSLHRDLKIKIQNEDVQMYAEPDVEWSTFQSFVGRLG